MQERGRDRKGSQVVVVRSTPRSSTNAGGNCKQASNESGKRGCERDGAETELDGGRGRREERDERQRKEDQPRAGNRVAASKIVAQAQTYTPLECQ
jgi:hypothetical protein